MTGLRCLCGNQLNHLHNTDGENQRTFVFHCPTCGNELALQLNLRIISRRDPRCGSDAGYQAHRRNHQTPCPPCVEAHTLRRRQDREMTA